MKYLLLAYTLLILSESSAQVKPKEPESFSSIIPEINTTNDIEIGTSLVSKEVGYKYRALKILKDMKMLVGYSLKDVRKGDIFINDSYNRKYDFYSALNTTTLGTIYGIAIPKAGGKAITFYRSPFTTFNKDNSPIEYAVILTPIPKKDYFKQEFIYNGKVGNAVKFSYREFANDLARPAFTQDLQYDLTESKIIGFKGLRVEILSATNIKIQYKVLSYFAE
jgi:hypothetical protein